jgi:hypothetical protein
MFVMWPLQGSYRFAIPGWDNTHCTMAAVGIAPD